MNLDIEFADSLTEDQVHDLVRLYQSEWWTGGRIESQVREMLQNCDVIVALSDKQTGRLLGFARVLTDFVYKALIFDVIVANGYRSKGLGQMLMDHIVNHPNLRSVKHLELYCVSEMVPFYRRWGFTNDIGELQLMRRSQASLNSIVHMTRSQMGDAYRFAWMPRTAVALSTWPQHRASRP